MQLASIARRRSFAMKSSRASWPRAHLTQKHDAQSRDGSPGSLLVDRDGVRFSAGVTSVGYPNHGSSGGVSFFDGPVQRCRSEGQSSPQTPALASKAHAKMRVSVQTDRAVTVSELQDIFSALEQHKQEQHKALQVMKSELDARISKLEDKMHPIHCLVKAIQNRCTDQQEQLKDLLKPTKKEFTQIKHDLMTKFESSMSSNMNRFPVDGLFPDLQKNSYTDHLEMLIQSAANVENTLLPIVEETEFDVSQGTQALPLECRGMTHGAQGCLCSMHTDGKRLEQKLESPAPPGKTLQYILENTPLLERAALGRASDNINSACDHPTNRENNERGKSSTIRDS